MLEDIGFSSVEGFACPLIELSVKVLKMTNLGGGVSSSIVESNGSCSGSNVADGQQRSLEDIVKLLIENWKKTKKE